MCPYNFLREIFSRLPRALLSWIFLAANLSLSYDKTHTGLDKAGSWILVKFLEVNKEIRYPRMIKVVVSGQKATLRVNLQYKIFYIVLEACWHFELVWSLLPELMLNFYLEVVVIILYFQNCSVLWDKLLQRLLI